MPQEQTETAAPHVAHQPPVAAAREAALREVLGVISQSRDDEQPVFDVILRSAARLCAADLARLHLVSPNRDHFTLVADWGHDLTDIELGTSWPLSLDHHVPNTIRAAATLHEPDTTVDPLYVAGDPIRRRLVDDEGVRSQLLVPLVADTEAIGCIALSRRRQCAFAEDEIALVETFATQAVIAIENARQFRELQTRLEREAATREILSAINKNRDDEQPVFAAILKSAVELCEAQAGRLVLVNEERTHTTTVAVHGPNADTFQVGQEFDLESTYSPQTAIRELRCIAWDDLRETPRYEAGDPLVVKMVDRDSARSMLAVPLISGGVGIGAIALNRTRVQPFTLDEVALIETFAAQAVIAIENVRQFRELQTRLEREAATKEVLQVISQSRDDDAPVFEAILEQAARLCKVPQAGLIMANEDRTSVTYAACWGTPSKHFQPGVSHWSIDSPIAITTTVREGRVVNIPDTMADEVARQNHPDRLEIVEEEEIRSVLAVPLMKDGIAIGCIDVYRREVDPFTDDDIKLLENFAAQAVIAIDNVRQFKSLEARTQEVQTLNASLEARVEDQVGEIERMGKLKRFLPSAVADAVVSKGEDMLSSHRALIAVLFCDIRGFTAFCETAEPEETIEFLQTYHQEMGKLIAQHGAGVDHRSGDGIMVIFNDPLPCDDPAGAALDLARAMHVRMVQICADWRKLGHRLGFGTGLSLGYATVGMVGYEGRYDYTANGPAVNLAARLCEVAKDGEILLSPRAFIALEGRVEAEPTGELILKGIAKPVEAMKLQA